MVFSGYALCVCVKNLRICLWIMMLWVVKHGLVYDVLANLLFRCMLWTLWCLIKVTNKGIPKLMLFTSQV